MLVLTLVSHLNRNAMTCDLHQTRIYKKVLRKGRIWLNLIRDTPIGRMSQNELEITEISRGDMQIHGELHGEQI